MKGGRGVGQRSPGPIDAEAGDEPRARSIERSAQGRAVPIPRRRGTNKRRHSARLRRWLSFSFDRVDLWGLPLGPAGSISHARAADTFVLLFGPAGSISHATGDGYLCILHCLL